MNAMICNFLIICCGFFLCHSGKMNSSRPFLSVCVHRKILKIHLFLSRFEYIYFFSFFFFYFWHKARCSSSFLVFVFTLDPHDLSLSFFLSLDLSIFLLFPRAPFGCVSFFRMAPMTSTTVFVYRIEIRDSRSLLYLSSVFGVDRKIIRTCDVGRQAIAESRI